VTNPSDSLHQILRSKKESETKNHLMSNRLKLLKIEEERVLAKVNITRMKAQKLVKIKEENSPNPGLKEPEPMKFMTKSEVKNFSFLNSSCMSNKFSF
jgi:superfamily I DNA/RNA helicase